MLLPAGALLILLEVVHGCGVDARLRDPYIARELRASRCGHLIALIVNLALVALLLYAGIVLPLWSLWCGCALLFWVLVAAALLVWIHQLLLWCCEPRADEAAAAEPVTKATAALVHSAILSPNPGAGQVAPAGMTPLESRKTTAAKLLRRIVSQAVATQQPLEHVLATSFQQVEEGPEGDRGRFRATFEEITPPPLSVQESTPAPAPPRLGEVLEEGEEGGSPMVKVRPPSLVSRSMAPPSPAM